MESMREKLCQALCSTSMVEETAKKCACHAADSSNTLPSSGVAYNIGRYAGLIAPKAGTVVLAAITRAIVDALFAAALHDSAADQGRGQTGIAAEGTERPSGSESRHLLSVIAADPRERGLQPRQSPRMNRYPHWIPTLKTLYSRRRRQAFLPSRTCQLRRGSWKRGSPLIGDRLPRRAWRRSQSHCPKNRGGTARRELCGFVGSV